MKQIVDQSAHVAAALIGLAPLAIWPSPFTGAVAGFMMGLVREMTEEGRIRLSSLREVVGSDGSRLDLAFWTIGGSGAGFLAYAF